MKTMHKRPHRQPAIDPNEAELLRAHAYGKTRAFLLAHPSYHPTAPQQKKFAASVGRRNTHEPVALILGYKAFFDVELAVARGVLIPRPETELLVEHVMALAQRGGTRAHMRIVDVGTGSGAIALTLATHLPQARITATDVSPKALALARKNARRLGLSRRVRFVQADLLPPQKQWRPNTVIVANLPYLPTAVWKKTAPDVQDFEPRRALDGGPDGLNLYRRLFAQVKKRTSGPLPALVIEIDPSQKKLLTKVVRSFFPHASLVFAKDLAGRWRMACITHP